MQQGEIAASLEASARRALDFAQQQVRRLITTHPDYFPLYTRGGRWHHEQEAWTNWCEGFLGGLLWIFARRTGDPWWRTKAEEYSRPLEPRQHDRNVHDLGFIFMSTYYRWYQITQDPALKDFLRRMR